MKKRIIYNLSPFNNNMDTSAAEYIIKKVLAFFLIYCVSAVLGEAIIIGILYCMGYDPLHGVMPAGQIGELLPYYGFIIFSLTTFAYCRFIEKRTINPIALSEKTVDYLLGAMLAVILLFIAIGICCFLGTMMFLGFNTDVNTKSLILWALGFGIQGAAEEIMCRGFLFRSLQKRISVPIAILISSTAFAIPHLPSLLEADLVYAVVGIMNLYLISIILSILVLQRSDIWIACGLHSVWNFILYVIMGLSLSGSESVSKGVILFSVKDASVLSGAEYGIEASFITTIVLGMFLFVTVIMGRGRIGKNGIQ